MTFKLPESLSPHEQFEVLEEMRTLSQLGFRRFEIVDTQKGPRIQIKDKHKRDVIIDKPLPSVLEGVTSMRNDGFTSIVHLKDGRKVNPSVTLASGEEIRYTDWLAAIAEEPNGLSLLRELHEVMVPPLSNYRAYAGTPRAGQFLEEIDSQQHEMVRRERQAAQLAKAGENGKKIFDEIEASNDVEATAASPTPAPETAPTAPPKPVRYEQSFLFDKAGNVTPEANKDRPKAPEPAPKAGHDNVLDDTTLLEGFDKPVTNTPDPVPDPVPTAVAGAAAAAVPLADLMQEAVAKRDELFGNPEKAVNITDITKFVGLSQEELKAIYDANIGPFDLETTGLKPATDSISEVSALRVVQGKDGQFKVMHFHAFCSPERPEYQQYLDAKAAGEPIAYDRKKFEYNVNLDALAVTDTQYVRPDPAGPITQMIVSGKKEACAPFYKVLAQYDDFRKGIDQSAYNAPFDNPMQAKKKAEVIGAGSTVDAPQSATNPAHYVCQMLLTLREIGQWPSNRLDDAYRTLVDHDFKGRGSHLAFEDNVMLIKITSALLKKYGKSMSTIDIYQDVIHEADPGAQLTANDRGDITITFSANPEALGDKAKKLWDFFESLNEAKWRNPRIPRNIDSLVVDGKERAPVDKQEEDKRRSHSDDKSEDNAEKPYQRPEPKPGEYSVSINGHTSGPLIFPMLKKMMMYDDILDKKMLDTVSFFDSSGKVDTQLPVIPGKSNGPQYEDVPIGSLRLNYQYLASRPESLQDNIQLIKKLSAMPNVGLVILSDNSIKIKPYQRHSGEVSFTIPEGTKPADHVEKISENIRFLSSIGGIPGVVSATEEWDDDDDKDMGDDSGDKSKITGVIETKIAMGKPDHIDMEISAALSQCLLHANQGMWPDGIKATQTKDGSTQLEGNKSDFEKFKHTIKDMSWLLHRVSKLPGTHSFELAKDGTAMLHQDWGVTIEAMQILEASGIPFVAEKRTIKVNIDQLMKEAYRYSGSIEEAGAQIKANAKLTTSQKPPPKHLVDLQAELWKADDDKHHITSLRMDASRRKYATLANGQTCEIRPNADGAVMLAFDDDDRLCVPVSSVASAGHFEAVTAPSSYEIFMENDTTATGKRSKVLDNFWEVLVTDGVADKVERNGDRIVMPHDVYAEYAPSIRRRKGLGVAELKSEDVRFIAGPVMLAAMEKLSGSKRDEESKGGFIQMPKEAFERHKQVLIPLGNQLHTLETVHHDSALPLSDIAFDAANGTYSAALPSVATLADMDYVKHLDGILPEFGKLSKCITDAHNKLSVAPDDELRSARHGNPLRLLAHAEENIKSLQSVEAELDKLMHYGNPDAKPAATVMDPSAEPSKELPYYFDKLLTEFPEQHRSFDAAAQSIAQAHPDMPEPEPADKKSLRLVKKESHVQTAASPVQRTVDRISHTSNTLAATLSTGNYHLLHMVEQQGILHASIKRTTLAMSEMYVALAREDEANRKELTEKARELWERYNPLEEKDDEGKEKAKERHDQAFEKFCGKVDTVEENPYVVLQQHKKLISAVFAGTNNTAGALDNLRRHTNQANFALKTLADMMSPAAARGSFVRDRLPRVNTMLKNDHLSSIVRELCAQNIPFSIEDGKLSVSGDALKIIKPAGQAPALTKDEQAFLEELSGYLQQGENKIAFKAGEPKQIEVDIDAGKGTGEKLTMKFDFKKIPIPMRKVLNTAMQRGKSAEVG